MSKTDMFKLELRKSIESDLDIFFTNQLDQEANYLAAFTSKDPTDKNAYMGKWKKLLGDKTINMQTIIFNGKIAGCVVKFEIEGEPEITYWIGKEFWGQGIATNALKDFLLIEKVRPILGRVAFDNFSSQRVLEKCGFEKIATDKGFANARGKEIKELIYSLNKYKNISEHKTTNR